MTGRFLVVLILTIALATAGASAQSKKKRPPKSKNTPADKHAQARADVITATNQYKADLEKLIALLEVEVKKATAEVEKQEPLVEAGFISKLELEKSQQAVASAQARLDQARNRVKEADALIAEVKAQELLAKLPPVPVGGYRATNAIIRYNGPSAWVLADAAKIDGFFRGRFGRVLPISALGQTAVHDRMGFDHRHAIDVAIHPDSPEGQALIFYLRGEGIPFLAFRQAIPGSATGAHIHIGRPSHRIGR